MPEKLNKLQIRATVFEIIKSYKKDSDFESELHIKNLNILNSISEKKFVCEILLKELPGAKDIEQEAIKYLIADFGTLEIIEDTIWTILQNPDISDKHKEIYLKILRLLGGKVDISALMSCMNDFDSIVDEQTQELLEQATVNPEAQIDFLDFLFSLNAKEQILLIKSLNGDFKGDELVNMLAPTLRIKLADEVKAEVISIFAESESYFAIKPLKNYIESNQNSILTKQALKALNQLKTNGIDIDNEDAIKIRESELCKSTTFYKAFLSQVDGCGNQGLIFSRITDNKKITMFSVVINSSSGIIDCFGLQDISQHDFAKVITRFKANDMVVPITAEIAKYKLLQAQRLNNNQGHDIPYEYLCWNIYTSDITPNEIDYNALLTEQNKKTSQEMYDSIYCTEVFDTWFFEYDDNRIMQELLNKVIQHQNGDTNKLFTLIEEEIDTKYYEIFTEEKLNEYYQMLKDTAYIFYLNNDFERSNICANIASKVKNGKIKFLKDILRRSILQYLATLTTENEPEGKNYFISDNKPNISDKEAFELLQNLENKWDKLDNE